MFWPVDPTNRHLRNPVSKFDIKKTRRQREKLNFPVFIQVCYVCWMKHVLRRLVPRKGNVNSNEDFFLLFFKAMVIPLFLSWAITMLVSAVSIRFIPFFVWKLYIYIQIQIPPWPKIIKRAIATIESISFLASISNDLRLFKLYTQEVSTWYNSHMGRSAPGTKLG